MVRDALLKFLQAKLIHFIGGGGGGLEGSGATHNKGAAGTEFNEAVKSPQLVDVKGADATKLGAGGGSGDKLVNAHFISA